MKAFSFLPMAAVTARVAMRIAGIMLVMMVIGLATADTALAQKSGHIVGKLVDSQSGEPLIGASVFIEGTTMGAQTDLDGNYLIKRVPPGSYTVMISSIGYNTVKIELVEVKSDESYSLDYALESKSITLDKIVVKAKTLQNTDAGLLVKRQNSNTISDAISAESITQSGSGDAAEAMSRVTGASVVGGKYVYVRGLGERYSNARLNGTILPSADPNKRSVQMDLFPTGLLDNITVEKTFTPDKPGSFSGGSVDLKTKDLPERLTMSLSTSVSHNSNANLNGEFLSSARGSKEWLAYSDGFYDLPDELANNELPNYASASKDPAEAQLLDQLSKSFNSSFQPIKRKSPLNQSYAFSFGNNYSLWERPLGVLASLSYSHSYSYYDDGVTTRWDLTGYDAPSLTNEYYFSDIKGVEDVLWGGMLSMNYRLGTNHKLSGQYVYNRHGEHEARYLTGTVWEDFNSEADVYPFETRAVSYIEQSIGSLQLNGDHYFKPLKTSWKAAFTSTDRNEPDQRFFSNTKWLGKVADYPGQPYDERRDTVVYMINASMYPVPAHYYRDLAEDNREYQLDFSLPLGKREGRETKLSWGTSYLDTDREVNESRYNVNWDEFPDGFSVDGDPDNFTSDDNMGLIGETVIVNPNTGDTIRYYADFANFLTDGTSQKNNYSGDVKITAGYGMIDFSLTKRLSVLTGVRFEHTKMTISNAALEASNADSLLGEIDENDWLPSLSIIYRLQDDMNVRLAYGRTLARPTLRELSPVSSFEFVKGFLLVGNPDLKHTRINNFDARWEWFPHPGELFAVSGFYKRFYDPIERTIIDNNLNIQYQNVDRGVVYGAEFEIRKSLDLIHDNLRNWSIDGNFTLTHSEVDLGVHEASKNKGDTRPLQGQSPYLLNIRLLYDNFTSGTSFALLYNVFGERLSEVSGTLAPDVYEQPRHMFDVTLSKRLWGGLTFKTGVKNIFDSNVKKTIEYDKEYVFQEYSTGRTVSLGVTYKIQ